MSSSSTTYFDGRKCSQAWFVVLSAARRAGVGFHLNQGRRSIADQQHFYWIYRTYGHPLAAYPSSSAPHIRYGQANHAIDVGTPGVYALAAWIRRHGASPAWTVRGEPWHIELDLGELLGLVRRVGSGAAANPFPTLRRGARGKSVRRLQRLLHKHVNGAPRVDGHFGLRTKRAVERFQHKKGLKADGVVGPATWRSLRR